MTIELATAYVSVVPSVRGIQGELQRGLVTPSGVAGRQAGDNAGRGFHQGYAGWISRIAALTATIGISTAIEKVVSAGVQGAANLETLTTAFTSLLGSSKAATDQIKELQQFAASTPFSQQDVFGYAQQYFSLANSIGLAKDQVQPFLTTIGNIGAVTGASSANIHNAVLAIGQIGSAGKVTLDNLNQISEAFPGFNGAAAIASATGQTTAQVMKEISAGAIDAKTGVQALLLGMQQFPGAANAMAAQSQTLSGLFSTFKDNISISLTQAFQPLIPTIKTELQDLLPVVSAALNQFAPAITTFAQQIVPLLQPLITGFSQVFTSVFQALGPALAALSPVIQPLANSFVQLVTAVSPLVTFLAQIVAQIGPPILAIFNQLFAALQPVIIELTAALLPVLPVIADSLSQLSAALAPVVQQLAGDFASVITQLAPELPALAQAFGDLAVQTANLLNSVLPLLQPLTDMLGLFDKGAAKLVEAFATGLAHIIGWVNDLIDRLTELLQLTGHDVTIKGIGSLSPVLQQAADAANSAAQGVLNIAAAAGQAAAATIGLGQALGSAAGQAIGAPPVGLGLGITPGSLKIPSIKTPKTPAAKLPGFDSSTLSAFFNQATGGQANPLTAALNSIFASANAAGKKLSSGLVATLRSQNAELTSLTRQRDTIATRLQNAQQRLAGLIQQRNQERSTIASAITGTFNLGNIPKPAFGEPITFSSILRQVTKAAANARAFGSALRRLAKEGLAKGLLQQLAEAGPDALPAARALLAATPKQLGQINAQFKSLGASGRSTGKFIANDMFKSGIDAAQGLVNGLKSQRSALNRAIRDLAKGMVRELKNTLGIHSPSKVMHELGQFSGEGFARGLGSKLSAVQASASALSNGALPGSQARAWAAGAGGSGQIINLTQNIHNPIPEHPSRTTPASLRRAAYALGR